MRLRARAVALSGRFAARLVAGMLIVLLPTMIVLGVLLTNSASNSLIRAKRLEGETVARSIALRVEAWTTERQENIAIAAAEASGQITSLEVSEELGLLNDIYDDFVVVEVTDLTGKVVAASRPGGAFDAGPDEDWFRTAVSGKEVLTSLQKHDGSLRWIVAAPVFGPGGETQGVVVGDLDASVLPTLLDPELQQDEAVIAVDRDQLLVYDTHIGDFESDAELVTAGALSEKVDNVAVRRALAGGIGGTDFEHDGTRVVGGYDSIENLGWAVLVTRERSDVLAPVATQRRAAILVILVGTVIAVVFSLWFARRTTRPLVRTADTARRVAEGELDARVTVEGATELRELGASFNAMVESLGALVSQSRTASSEMNASASELSASSEELAATTTQQSAAVTQVSATTEELARASLSIAHTVDEVAAHAAETRDNLEQAEVDMQASSAHTLALAERVNEIGAILTLINEIADQTNLLALNAAIEAARAGESGRGFAVVAEEVRRLAERSKRSAAEIALITDGVHAETNGTVMAMEKGAKQMQRGLALLEDVSLATEQVRLTTQQQRSATTQVVETMEQLSDSSRQVSATAQQLASASASLVALANNLEHSAAVASGG